MSVVRAREMRKALTPQEARLWARLKQLRAEGYHFRRQAPFRGWFLDFVSFNHRLVIEVDGGQHNTESHEARDAVRDAALAREGFLTLRFWNRAVNTNFEGVMTEIRNALEQRRPTRPLRVHPPHEGEGDH